MFFEFSSISTITVGISLFLILLFLWRNTRRQKDLPPGPSLLPFLGNSLILLKTDIPGVFRGLRKIYGDIFCLYVGTKPFVVINGYKMLKDIFMKNGEMFSDRPADMRSNDGKSRGIIGTSGELWKVHRKFAMTTLRNFGLGKTCMESTIKSEIECLLETIKLERGQPIDMSDAIRRSIANIICSVAFSKRFEDGDGRFLGLTKNIEDLSKRRGINVGLGFKAWFKFLPIDIFGIKHLQSIFEQTNDYLREVYDEHVQTFDGDCIRDYIDAFIQEQKSAELNGVVSDFTELSDLFQAGTEATTTALRWALLYMLKYPKTQDKIRAEIDELIGSGNAPSLKDRSNMHYTEAFISETLRYACIAPMAAPHCATKPFSLGPRVSLGQSLAEMELFLFLTILVQLFIFTRPDVENDTHLDIVGVRGIVHIPTPYRLCANLRL
ncbi:hypothetical protein ScPMuIL_016391 [Solemya velum]